MQSDHCIWLGGCVGWANHKVCFTWILRIIAHWQFFMTFLFWAALYCLYILVVLIIYLTRVDVDGQVIGLIAV